MTRRRLAPLALAVVATGVLGLSVTSPAWAAPASPSANVSFDSDGRHDKEDKSKDKDARDKDARDKDSRDHKSTDKRDDKRDKKPTHKPTPKPTKKTVTPTKKTVKPTETKKTLPVTGSATTGLLLAGSGLVVSGAFLLGLMRRRREE